MKENKMEIVHVNRIKMTCYKCNNEMTAVEKDSGLYHICKTCGYVIEPYYLDDQQDKAELFSILSRLIIQ